MSNFSALQKKYKNLNNKYQEISKAPLISDLIVALLVTSASSIFNTFFPALSTEVLVISSILALLVFLFILRVNKSWALGGTAALVVLGISVLLFGQKYAPRGGAYIILDYSENMQSTLEGTSISNLITLAAWQISDNLDVGLMISGGPFTDDEDKCYRVNEIQPPAPKDISLPNIESLTAHLDDFSPQGPGNIEYAVLQALSNLAGRENVQEIIVITSGLDESCETLNRSLLDLAAGEKNIEYTLTILAIGTQSEYDADKLNRFAHKYKEAPLASDIPSLIEAIIEEPIFSYYSP